MLGPRDTTSLVMLTGWDAAALKTHQLMDGTTFDVVVAQMRTALGALNAELYADPIWSSLVSYTDQPDVEYRVGNANGFERFTEHSRADAKRAQTEGHMLPLKAFDRALGWTWNYLRQARMSQVQADIADAIQDARDVWRKTILQRLLKRGDDSGVADGLGSSGLSAGFATASGNTGVDFTPPAFGGNTFTDSHEHYVGASSLSNTVFSAAKTDLRHHGHEPPYYWLASPTDEAAISGLTDFVKVANTNIKYGNGVDLATIAQASITPGVYPLGVIHDFVVWVMPGMPQHYGFGWKTYGPNSQRNPIRIRLQKGQSQPGVVAMPDPRSGNAAWPLQYMMLFLEFGVGVADRTNGTTRYTNNVTWADGVAA